MKIRWTAQVCATPDETERNIRNCKSLYLPEIKLEKGRPPLAVVGGGPSVADYVDELRAWVGDIWVSGSAFPWSQRQGIRATFFTIDQHPSLANDGRGAKRAILATCCHPDVFDELKNAQIEVFDLIHSGLNANHNATTVTAAPKIALDMGYTDLTFFGCDSSYTNQTHAYYDEPVKDLMRVQCSEHSYLTNPGMLMQAEFMAQLMRAAPHVFKNKGYGLLPGLVAAGDYDITHGSRDLVERVCGKAA